MVITSGAGTQRVHYRYDAFGRRIRKDNAASTIEYVWAGDHVLFDIKDSVVTEYSYLPGTDRLHAQFRNGQFRYFLTDHLGSVAAVADSAGIKANSYQYDPWGRTESASEQVENRFRFTGRDFDSQAGLYYLRARFYDPASGRFASEDPIGLLAGLNPYSYAANSPLTLRDPFGLDECPPPPPTEPPTAIVGQDPEPGPQIPEPRYCTLPVPDDPMIPRPTPERPAPDWPGRFNPPMHTPDRGLPRHGGGRGSRQLAARDATQLSPHRPLMSCRTALYLEFGARVVTDLALAYVYSTGVGLVVRGGLLVLEGGAISSGLILTATVEGPGITGAALMWTGGAMGRLGAQSIAAAYLAVPKGPGVSAIPGGNTLIFFNNGGFGQCP